MKPLKRESREVRLTDAKKDGLVQIQRGNTCNRDCVVRCRGLRERSLEAYRQRQRRSDPAAQLPRCIFQSARGPRHAIANKHTRERDWVAAIVHNANVEPQPVTIPREPTGDNELRPVASIAEDRDYGRDAAAQAGDSSDDPKNTRNGVGFALRALRLSERYAPLTPELRRNIGGTLAAVLALGLASAEMTPDELRNWRESLSDQVDDFSV